jgi:uncharacterized membrane protein
VGRVVEEAVETILARKGLFLAVCVLGVCALAGCSRTEVPTTTTNTNVAQPMATAATTMASADTTTGIAECDALLVKMKKCMESNTLSDPLKAGYRNSFEPARKGYREMAAGTPQQRAQGAHLCQAVMDAAKATFDTCK